MIGRGLVLTATGLSLGFARAWAMTITMRSLLVGVGTTNAATFSSVIGLLLVVSLAACCVPAVPAVRIDPMRVLRQDV